MGWMSSNDVVPVHTIVNGQDCVLGGLMTVHGHTEQRWLMVNCMSSQHFLSNPPAVAIDAGGFDRNKQTPQNRAGFTHIGILDQETGWMYGLTLRKFWEKHEPHNAHDQEKLLKYGLQYKVALEDWTKVPIRDALREPGTPLVTLEMTLDEQAIRDKAVSDKNKAIADTEEKYRAQSELQRLAKEAKEKKALAKSEFQRLKKTQGSLF